ncbi:NAD(P)-dependent oxidoreductase [Nonomuraea sp. NPDC050310]|uniref:NAD-dependent epimerase/dehydratase family protein n=1 Tax=Nonomuraea sp. NPDC050310 TaxID=3154935 RepID=UPI0034091861
MTAILLLGGSGFIGRHVRALLEADPRVTSLTCAGRARLDLLNAGTAEVAELLRESGASVVLSCVGRLTGPADLLLRANAGVVAQLIEAMGQVCPRGRLVRLGSAAEYGVTPPGTTAGEDDPARPVSFYGVSHLAGTGLVGNAPVEALSLRVFNPVGPGVSAQNVLGRAAALFAEAVATGQRAVRMGSLGAMRDFVDVRDVAAAVVAAAFAGPAGVYNVGSGQAVPVRLPVRLLAQEAGFSGEILEEEDESARSAGVTWSQADIGRARRLLGWSPQIPLTASVREMWLELEGARCAASSP